MCLIKTHFFVCKGARYKILATCKNANLMTNNTIARPQISAHFSHCGYFINTRELYDNRASLSTKHRRDRRCNLRFTYLHVIRKYMGFSAEHKESVYREMITHSKQPCAFPSFCKTNFRLPLNWLTRTKVVSIVFSV